LRERKLIFISHATPEDNDFVFWLGARLASAGYRVWSDVTKLIGGEVFWDDIEAAIRHESAKVISVFSGAAIDKDGFKDELSLALLVGKSDKLKDFVIPVRLDSTSFDQFPVQIVRRNAIDAFRNGWHAALAKILKKLELDNVPRDESIATDALSDWSKSILDIDGGLIKQEETLISNWLPIKEMPLSIRVHSCLPGFPPFRSELYAYPAEVHGGKVISFAGAPDLVSQGLEQECEISLDNFLRGGVKGLFEIHPKAASNLLTGLLQRAWYRLARSHGLKDFLFANNKSGFYLPLPIKGIERIKFFSPTGKKRNRALIGKSEKRNVYWHFTPELIPSLGRSPRFTLFSHVIFTKDGLSPIGDATRMHALRRSFCRSWWQDRWRDLGIAYLSFLLEGSEDLLLPLSPERSLVVDASFESFVSPVAVIMDAVVASEEDSDPINDLNDDEDDSDEDIEAFMELVAEDESVVE